MDFTPILLNLSNKRKVSRFIKFYIYVARLSSWEAKLQRVHLRQNYWLTRRAEKFNYGNIKNAETYWWKQAIEMSYILQIFQKEKGMEYKAEWVKQFVVKTIKQEEEWDYMQYRRT